MELRSAARSAVVSEASLAFQRRLEKGPYEREELAPFQKIIKTDSTLKLDQVIQGLSDFMCAPCYLLSSPNVAFLTGLIDYILVIVFV